MTQRLPPAEWSQQYRATWLSRIIYRMAVRKTAEQRLWCAVLCRTARDVCSQNHDADFWHEERGRVIADICRLDIVRIRRWAGQVGLEL